MSGNSGSPTIKELIATALQAVVFIVAAVWTVAEIKGTTERLQDSIEGLDRTVQSVLSDVDTIDSRVDKIAREAIQRETRLEIIQEHLTQDASQ